MVVSAPAPSPADSGDAYPAEFVTNCNSIADPLLSACSLMWRSNAELRREKPQSLVRGEIGEVGDWKEGDLAGTEVRHSRETGWGGYLRGSEPSVSKVAQLLFTERLEVVDNFRKCSLSPSNPRPSASDPFSFPPFGESLSSFHEKAVWNDGAPDD